VTKRTLHSPKLPSPLGAYSQAVEVTGLARMLYVSGLTAREPDGSVYGVGDVRAQTERVLDSLAAILETAGGSLQDVVRVVYVRDITQWPAVHEVRSRYFRVDPPASSMVEVSRLVHEDLLIEIEATAAL
jgi:reactive intermediate/imine deaminase